MQHCSVDSLTSMDFQLGIKKTQSARMCPMHQHRPVACVTLVSQSTHVNVQMVYPYPMHRTIYAAFGGHTSSSGHLQKISQPCLLFDDTGRSRLPIFRSLSVSLDEQLIRNQITRIETARNGGLNRTSLHTAMSRIGLRDKFNRKAPCFFDGKINGKSCRFTPKPIHWQWEYIPYHFFTFLEVRSARINMLVKSQKCW